MFKAPLECLSLGALALLSSLALCYACAEPACAPEPKSPSVGPAFTDGVVPVGTLKLHLHCEGQGSPLIVFESGSGDDGTVWRWLQRDLAKLTRACAYDRAGLGNSEPGQKPRTSQQMADELYALLEAAHQPAPYVLVGHSAGGLNVRLFASRYASEVAGMVLVDVVSSAYQSRFMSLLPPEVLERIKRRMRKIPDGWEFDSFVESLNQVASAPALGDIPLVVLSAGQSEPPQPGVSDELHARLLAIENEMQAELSQLSTNSARVVAPKSGHYIQWDAPALVVESITEVVRAARVQGRVDGARLAALAGATTGP
jgi:pimeloyl-ACP methyl ester carboxylesterase